MALEMRLEERKALAQRMVRFLWISDRDAYQS
jgi:hypothetical protein